MLQKFFRPAPGKTLKYLKDRAWSGHSGIKDNYSRPLYLIKKKTKQKKTNFIADRGVLEKQNKNMNPQ